MQYAAAKLTQRLETAAFRKYLADALFLMAQGKYWDKRWDIAQAQKAETHDADPDEIKSRIKSGLKGLIQ